VWIKRVGNNPKLKLLLLTGGPGFSHSYLEVMDSFLPAEGVEYYHYDQLETGESDKPNDPDLWTLQRYVDEVDQVRKAIGGTKDNFCLLGHSWGGLLAIEYALARQDQLKCLVISNMMASIPAYNTYAKNVLEPQMNQAALKEILAMEAAGQTEQPALHGGVGAQLVRAAHPKAAGRRLAGATDPRLPEDESQLLRDDAGTERNGRQRTAGKLGPVR
jgi:proline iminopeptidase